MNEDLEMYLMKVARQLRDLPPQQREAELREIESHLRAMIEAREVGGVLYSDAVSESLRQFGNAPRVGRDIKRAWHKNQSEHPLRAIAAGLGAVGCQLGMFELYNWLLPPLTSVAYEWNFYQRNHYALWVNASFAVLRYSTLLTPAISGLVAHAIAPRRGWWVALTAYCSTIVVFGLVCLGLHQGFVDSLSVILNGSLLIPGVLLGAWVSKRRQERRASRNLLAN